MPCGRNKLVNVVSKLRVLNFAISIDGYGAGPNQDLQNPLGLDADLADGYNVPMKEE